MKIVEVVSRFEDQELFIKAIQTIGFKLISTVRLKRSFTPDSELLQGRVLGWLYVHAYMQRSLLAMFSSTARSLK